MWSGDCLPHVGVVPGSAVCSPRELVGAGYRHVVMLVVPCCLCDSCDALSRSVCSANGMPVAALAGHVLAELALGLALSADMRMFDPARTMPSEALPFVT